MRLDCFITESSNVNPYDMVVDVYNRSMPYIMELIREFHHINLDTRMLFSGRKSEDAIINAPIRTNRRPKDTSFNAHAFLDEMFYKTFGVRARSESIFVTGNFKTADSYGDKVYAIFPNGTSYKIIWSPSINDLYSDIMDSGEHHYIGMSKEDIIYDIMQDGSLDYDATESLESNFMDNNNIDDFENEDEFYEARDKFVEDNLDKEILDMAEQEAESRMGNSEDDIGSIIRSDYKEGHLKDAILSGNEIMLSGKSYTGVRSDYLPFLLRYMEVHGAKKPTRHMFDSAMVGLNANKLPGNLHTSQQELIKRLSKDILSTIDISDLKK